MKTEIFFIIQRKKDGLYYMSTDDGQHTFVSSMKLAQKFTHRQLTLDQIKSMQNWLGRPKFVILTGQQIRH